MKYSMIALMGAGLWVAAARADEKAEPKKPESGKFKGVREIQRGQDSLLIINES